ncbi:MAG: RNA polymerase sigma-70 factor [Bacteroidota bacterium]
MSLSQPSFEKLFKELFKPLCGFAMKYVSDLDESKNLVHEVFIALWEKQESLPPESNYKSYLYTSVRNRCLNYLRDRKKMVSMELLAEEAIEDDATMEAGELEKKIQEGISLLPEKCREVFELSRLEGLKYAQIAEKLGISVKTVEAQMSKALGILRAHLGEFLSLLFFWWRL